MNRLAKEKSPYLRHSADQGIDWHPWSNEPFERAKKEDKPIFLSSGAIWCHWCHVMAKECFENKEIAGLLNDNFINIKLDRDERPDIDRIYQQAVAAMGSGGGWPLSVFLTPDRKPFFGGTYFPPEDAEGRPGFKTLLKKISDFYKEKREDIDEYTGRLIDFLKPSPLLHGEIREPSIKDAVKDILSEFDPQNGGFGTSPKFPMPGALEFLINRYFLSSKDVFQPPIEPLTKKTFEKDFTAGFPQPSDSIDYAVKKTLEAMAKGGFYDQVGGGFHRYSTDEAWIIPHFEKMADDNAWLLRNYIDAYCVFGDEYFKDVAKRITDFIFDTFSDPDGGFYASQDADVTPDDEGGYFTWTDDDLKRVLEDEQYRILSLHLFHERGSLHHDKSKRVLFIAMEAEEIAVKLGEDIHRVIGIIDAGKKKLLMERKKREMPFIDKTFYTSINGMLISSFLRAYRTLPDNRIKEFALKSLDKIMKLRFAGNELFHSEGIKAVLDDYVYLTEALIAAYEATGDPSYRNMADELMELCIKKLWDKTEGGFFDSEEEMLGMRLKGMEDIPHPSANSIAVMLMLRLYYMTGKNIYYQYAETSLKAFLLRAKDTGIHSGYYFCALDAYFNMLRLSLYTTPESELARTALSAYSPYTSITYEKDMGYVLPCLRFECYEPLYTPEKLKMFLMTRKQK